MNIKIVSKREIERMMEEKTRTSYTSLNKQIDYLYSRIDSLEEDVKSLKILIKQWKTQEK